MEYPASWDGPAFRRGTAGDLASFFGCHRQTREGIPGYLFRLWAPNARQVSLTGDFNRWQTPGLPLEGDDGIWQIWTPLPQEGSAYQYAILAGDGTLTPKTDPFARRTCRLPDTAGMIHTQEDFPWTDGLWFARSARRAPEQGPMNIYSLHLGSWRTGTYSQLAPDLARYVSELGYTHVALLPLTEFPEETGWGYEASGFFAPTSRYGTPQELMELVNTLHAAGIGVILDWPGGSFAPGEAGLGRFDGSWCYERPDTRRFDLAKGEVSSFLLSSARFWLEHYHLDGLRLPGVEAMLYPSRDYRNRHGGRESSAAVEFLRRLTGLCQALRKGVILIAEESSAYPAVTVPPEEGGLGFTFKWNVGWSADTLRYFQEPPEGRKYKHQSITFSLMYAFSEAHILPLSHDDTDRRSGGLVARMPGDPFWKLAQLRLLRGYQMAHPGKKLHFMGLEFAASTPWSSRRVLDWTLPEGEVNGKALDYWRTLNRFYLNHEALWADDYSWDGFQWIQPDDAQNAVLAFRRMDRRKREVLVVCNFTPVVRESYRLGLPKPGKYLPVLCSDDLAFGGTGTTPREVVSQPVPFRDYGCSGLFRLPPMSVTYYTRAPGRPAKLPGES